MTVRIRVDELSEKLRECLERGERVEIERDGEIVGRVEPGSARVLTGWEAFLDRRRKHEPVDQEFEATLEEIRSTLNPAMGRTSWES